MPYCCDMLTIAAIRHFFQPKVWSFPKMLVSLQTQNNAVRGGAEVARWAHNPKVVGSNPAPAT